MKRAFFATLVCVVMFFVVLQAWGANTIVSDFPVYQITVNDADWTGPKRVLDSIQFNPAAADDEIVVKNGDADGAVIFQAKASDAYEEQIKYFDTRPLTPFIDVSECTVGSTFEVIVIYK